MSERYLHITRTLTKKGVATTREKNRGIAILHTSRHTQLFEIAGAYNTIHEHLVALSRHAVLCIEQKLHLGTKPESFMATSAGMIIPCSHQFMYIPCEVTERVSKSRVRKKSSK
jgi:hypothetical protein